jgi:hypothetical protein
MEENDQESCNVCLRLEQRHRDERVLSKLCLAVDERKNHNTAYNEQCYDLCRVPREQHASEVESKEDHEGAAKEGEQAKPVNGLHAVDKRCVLVLDVEEDQDQDTCQTADGQIDPD